METFLFDLYGTLADVHTDESQPALWEDVAADATARGAAYTAETYQRAYLALCKDEVHRRAAELPGVPEDRKSVV